jgi:hypothetical protein
MTAIETRQFNYTKFFSLPKCSGSWIDNSSGCLLTALWFGLDYSLEIQNKIENHTTFNENGSITFDAGNASISYPIRDRLIFETDVLAERVLGHKYPNGFPFQIETIAPITHMEVDAEGMKVRETVQGWYCPIASEPLEFTDAVINNFDNGNVSLAYDLMAELIQTVWGINLLETEKIDQLVCQTA